MKIKVCGMREAGNVQEVGALSPDYMGFIFYDRSPRNCLGISPGVIKGLPAGTEPVMVSVDKGEDEIMRIADRYGFRYLQLHGHETPEMCFSLRTRGMKVIKAAGMRSRESLADLREYEGAVDVFLLDTFCSGKGGSGKKFDWSILDSYEPEVDFWLSGGLAPSDAGLLKAFRHPRFAGVDINSRFEISPGVKDVEKVRIFINELKEEDKR